MEEDEFDEKKKQTIITGWLKMKSKQSNIVLKDAMTRNIIFLGRTRSGKSQTLKTLKDPFRFNTELSLFSETTVPSLHSFTMEYSPGPTQSPVNYNFNIMDTPGLFEQSVEMSQARNNELIKSTITKCLEFEITKIHAIFFVCSFTGGINMQDVDSIIQLNELFKGAGKTVSLLVTRCEGKLHKARLALEAQIRAISQLKDFFTQNDVKIFFMGTLDTDDYENGAVDAVRQKLNNILVLRTSLYQHFFQSQEECHITELDFFKREKQNLDELRSQVTQLQQKIETFQGTVEEKEKIQKELDLSTTKLSNTVSMISRLTGQQDIPHIESYAEIVKKSMHKKK